MVRPPSATRVPSKSGVAMRPPATETMGDIIMEEKTSKQVGPETSGLTINDELPAINNKHTEGGKKKGVTSDYDDGGTELSSGPGFRRNIAVIPVAEVVSKMLKLPDPQLEKRILDFYKTYLSTLCKICDGSSQPDECSHVLSIPLRDIFEYAVKDRRDVITDILNFMRDKILLVIALMGKSKINPTNENFELLTKFLYNLSMLLDYTLECLTANVPFEENSGKKLPKEANTLFYIWDALLSLVNAKDRRMRANFCTIAYLFVREACLDEVVITGELYTKHVDTFLSLLNDQNKNTKCRCLQLLEGFQNQNVREAMISCINDNFAAVRLAAVSYVEISDTSMGYKILQLLISRTSDISKEVRMGVYNRLGDWYGYIPMELRIQLLSYGTIEEDASIKRVFYTMICQWIGLAGGIVQFLNDFISQVADLSPLEATLLIYLNKSDFLHRFLDKDAAKGVLFSSIMKNIRNAHPAELFLLSVFFQNLATSEHVTEIKIFDLMSYLKVLIGIYSDRARCTSSREILPTDLDKERGGEEPDDFADALEIDESSVLPEYNEQELSRLKELYTNDYIICNALRNLLIIGHYGDFADLYQIKLCETTCDKILLQGPVRSMVGHLLSDVIIQTSLGNNSFTFAVPSKWLKYSYLFATISFIRYLYTKKFKLNNENKRTDQRHFENSLTTKILTVISDMKDPFQTSGIDNIRIGRDELERLDTAKIKQFNPCKYSIEHLNIFNKNLDEQIQQTKTQLTDLENLSKGSAAKSKVDDNQQAAMNLEKKQLNALLEKQVLFIDIIRAELKDRWARILVTTECHLAQTKSNCANDAGIAKLPQNVLLPQLSFFTSTVLRWKTQDLFDQYCDILANKCLGIWALLNSGNSEINRQLNAFHIAFKDILDSLNKSINDYQSHKDKETEDGKQESVTPKLLAIIRQRIELQTLTCEMYISILADLILSNINVAYTDDCAPGIIKTFWSIITGSLVTSKYIQSVAIRMASKLLVTEYFTNDTKAEKEICRETDTKQEAKSTDRLCGLLELVFIVPTAPKILLKEFKFIKNTRCVMISAEDKMMILNTCALYPTISYKHLKIYHKVLQQILMKSIHHALTLDVSMNGFSPLILFVLQTMLHKAPTYFSVTNFPKYLKWLLLLVIDKGSVLADKLSFMQLIFNLTCLFIKQDSPNKSNPYIHEGVRSLSDICGRESPSTAILDLHDVKLLLKYLLDDGSICRARISVQCLNDTIEMVSEQITKLAKLYAGSLKEAENGVSVIVDDNAVEVKFELEDKVAFSNLVDVYDSYISSLSSRKCYALITPFEDFKRTLRKSNRTLNKVSYYDSDDELESGSDQDDYEFDDSDE